MNLHGDKCSSNKLTLLCENNQASRLQDEAATQQEEAAAIR
jgi:hypothetical protein